MKHTTKTMGPSLMRFSPLFTILVCWVVLVALHAPAAPIVSDDWYVDEGWDIKKEDGTTPAFGTHTEPDSTLSGNPVPALKIARSSGSGVENDYVYDSGNLVGNWANMGGSVVQSITFDFYAGAGGAVDHPAGLRLYFKAGSGNVWYYNFVVTDLVSGWGSSYGANINPTTPLTGWWTTGDDSLWQSDFTNVNEVGIWISYQPNYANQIYGLDNFTLHDTPIPEPETYLVLGAVFLSLAIMFRRNLDASLAWLRGRFRG
ncbi:MAG: hypothetical protein QME60_02540 [Verrucomicrobiota bacterium]|nr:hypothetical protein [Verrucomicrobiota bacterium]